MWHEASIPTIQDFPDTHQWRINIGNQGAEGLQGWMNENYPSLPYQAVGGQGGWEGAPETSAALHLYETDPQLLKELLDQYGKDHPGEEAFGIVPSGEESFIHWNEHNPEVRGQLPMIRHLPNGSEIPILEQQRLFAKLAALADKLLGPRDTFAIRVSALAPQGIQQKHDRPFKHYTTDGKPNLDPLEELGQWLDSFNQSQEPLTIHHLNETDFIPKEKIPLAQGGAIDPPSHPYKPYNWAEEGWEESPLNRTGASPDEEMYVPGMARQPLTINSIGWPQSSAKPHLWNWKPQGHEPSRTPFLYNRNTRTIHIGRPGMIHSDLYDAAGVPTQGDVGSEWSQGELKHHPIDLTDEPSWFTYGNPFKSTPDRDEIYAAIQRWAGEPLRDIDAERPSPPITSGIKEYEEAQYPTGRSFDTDPKEPEDEADGIGGDKLVYYDDPLGSSWYVVDGGDLDYISGPWSDEDEARSINEREWKESSVLACFECGIDHPEDELCPEPETFEESERMWYNRAYRQPGAPGKFPPQPLHYGPSDNAGDSSYA